MFIPTTRIPALIISRFTKGDFKAGLFPSAGFELRTGDQIAGPEGGAVVGDVGDLASARVDVVEVLGGKLGTENAEEGED